MTLETRPLGTSSLQLTTIGIGTWAIGGGDWKFGWGDQDETEAVEAIVAGVAGGINWIDTAAVYGQGRSEELVAKALRKIPPHARPYVATKCGRIILPDGNVVGRLDPDSIRSECEGSLRRLEIDTIDLYQLHWPDPEAEIEAAWETLATLRKEGKVREIGVSNHSVAQLKRLQPLHRVASLQPPYSLLARDGEAELLPYCGAERIGVIVYSPLGKGLLTGSFSAARAAQLPANDHRARDPRFQSPQLEGNLQFVERLRPIAESRGLSVAELAIAWTLRRSEVTSAIVGARRPAQITSVLGAASAKLSSDELRAIDGALAQRDAAQAAIR